jgi:hypothetical protein
MASLTESDFKLRQATCEVKFPEAFLVFDRTGEIYRQLARKFTNLHSDAASPAQTQMTAEEGSIGIEIRALRLTDNSPDSKLEKFAQNMKAVMDVGAKQLDLTVYTRIGLRQILTKKYNTLQDAETALNDVHLFKLGQEKRFGAGPNISEFQIRWEDKAIGATFRMKAESATLDAKLHPDLEVEPRDIHKELHHLVLDLDYYTVAVVEREQWDAGTWITQSARIVRKEADRILSA